MLVGREGYLGVNPAPGQHDKLLHGCLKTNEGLQISSSRPRCSKQGTSLETYFCGGGCRRGPGVHELHHLVSLMQTLLERGWQLPQALSTAWDQVQPSPRLPQHVTCCAHFRQFHCCKPSSDPRLGTEAPAVMPNGLDSPSLVCLLL